MGCDIHSYVEGFDGKFYHIPFTPFDWRAYGMFGFLADVRNYSEVPPISQPRGIPEDVCDYVKRIYRQWEGDAHSASWLCLDELSDFNYDAIMEDRRVTKQVSPNCFNGGCTCAPGEGESTTYRDFLGESFFNDIEKMKELGVKRVVFWFDN